MPRLEELSLTVGQADSDAYRGFAFEKLPKKGSTGQTGDSWNDNNYSVFF